MCFRCARAAACLCTMLRWVSASDGIKRRGQRRCPQGVDTSWQSAALVSVGHGASKVRNVDRHPVVPRSNMPVVLTFDNLGAPQALADGRGMEAVGDDNMRQVRDMERLVVHKGEVRSGQERGLEHK